MSETRTPALVEFLQVYLRALKLLSLQKVEAGAPAPSAKSILILTAMCLASYLACEALLAGSPMYFREDGLASLLGYWAVIAALIVILSAGCTMAPIGRAIADVAAISTFFNLTIGSAELMSHFIREHFGDIRSAQFLYGATVVTMALFFVTMWRIGRNLWPTRPRAAGLRILLAYTLAEFILPASPVFVGPNTSYERFDIWWAGDQVAQYIAPSQPEEIVRPVERDYETVLYRQKEMVETALQTIVPGSSEHPNFYFVSMAPSMSETVFRSEAMGAKSVADQHLGTKGRSLALVSSTETMHDTPLATLTNLKLTLDGLATRMNVDRDVLVLFITSHGTKEELSVQFPGATVKRFTADRLKDLLLATAIRNKVIILSACHSGSFVEKLSGDDTMIITASHADKTSFGCSNEREWTYFGDAFFNHALRETQSLESAFDRAKTLVGDWEKGLLLPASDPQISIGSRISERLKIMSTIRSAEVRGSPSLD